MCRVVRITEPVAIGIVAALVLASLDHLRLRRPWRVWGALAGPGILGGALAVLVLALREIDEQLNGDRLLLMDEGQSRMSLKGRTDMIVASLWTTTSAPATWRSPSCPCPTASSAPSTTSASTAAPPFARCRRPGGPGTTNR